MCPKKVQGLTSSAAGRGSQIANYAVVKLKQTTIPPVPIPLAILSRLHMCGTPSPTDQHLLPPSDAGEGHVDASSIVALAAAGLCSRPEAKSTGRAGDKGDPRLRRITASSSPR
ncbi:unnamed protein product [Schistocephalus solidus]|uniref:Uncharacterized protein n=1 Tax=Schistocephalus solidus TaxID=70667 RepID=A0A183TE79_SCHSO|nr:unnamed protein product [Schistocephalus solidus]